MGLKMSQFDSLPRIGKHLPRTRTWSAQQHRRNLTKPNRNKNRAITNRPIQVNITTGHLSNLSNRKSALVTKIPTNISRHRSRLQGGEPPRRKNRPLQRLRSVQVHQEGHGLVNDFSRPWRLLRPDTRCEQRHHADRFATRVAWHRPCQFLRTTALKRHPIQRTQARELPNACLPKRQMRFLQRVWKTSPQVHDLLYEAQTVNFPSHFQSLKTITPKTPWTNLLET